MEICNGISIVRFKTEFMKFASLFITLTINRKFNGRAQIEESKRDCLAAIYPDELDKISRCALSGMKAQFYCHGCCDKDKSRSAMPLC